MQIYQYPVVKFQLHQILKTHKDFFNLQNWCLSSEECQKIYDSLINDKSFIEVYNKFIKYITPIFNNAGLTPASQPLLRIHQTNNEARFYGSNPSLSRKSKIIFVPLTPLFGTNSFSVESKLELADFNILNLRVGDFFVHECNKNIFDKFINFSGVHSVSLIIGFNSVS